MVLSMAFNSSSGLTDSMMARVNASRQLRVIESATNYTTSGNGDNPHKHSYAYLALRKHDRVAEMLQGATVTEKVDGTGHNIVIPRLQDETHGHWRTRTADIAHELIGNLGMQPDCPHVTFNNGRIILQRTREAVAYINATNTLG